MTEGSLVKPMCCYLFLEPHINKKNKKKERKYKKKLEENKKNILVRKIYQNA
jgi:hypothetical protein